MSIQEKYKQIILKKYPAYSDENADLLADFLYQLAFTVVSNYLNERGKK